MLLQASDSGLGLFTKEVMVPPQLRQDMDFSGLFIKGGVSLVLVILLILALHYLLHRKQAFTGSSLLRILDCRVIDSRKSVYLLETCGKILVIGSSDAGLTLLSEITEKETVDEIKLQFSRSHEKDFGKALEKHVSRKEQDIAELQKKISKIRKMNDFE
ncbi:MAG: flagellar biosynthetic protein FliO [Candidatus Wallbacteria bacterium]|nr:flagellar biosynthetic protein FliO [Candidatus Wallbacteria bacterium]